MPCQRKSPRGLRRSHLRRQLRVLDGNVHSREGRGELRVQLLCFANALMKEDDSGIRPLTFEEPPREQHGHAMALRCSVQQVLALPGQRNPPFGRRAEVVATTRELTTPSWFASERPHVVTGIIHLPAQGVVAKPLFRQKWDRVVMQSVVRQPPVFASLFESEGEDDGAQALPNCLLVVM